jgi:zinc D-Ala-D-Ala dipeptidase
MKRTDFVDLSQVAPAIVLDVKYATDDNFVGKQVYPIPKCFLRRSTAEKLINVQETFEKMDLGLKVFDGYRPLAVQKIFWEFCPDSRYVGDPAIGSKHNRGAAVDLTLVNADGVELSMPTHFDDLSERAHRDYMKLSTDVMANRQLLEEIMQSHGFIALPTEWWHFDDTDWEQFPVEDRCISEL